MSQLGGRSYSLGLVKMALVGGVNTIAGYAVIFGLMALGTDPLASNVAGYAVGWILAFFLQRGWVFKGRQPRSGVEWRYILSVAASFAANLLILRIAIGSGFSAWISQIVAGIGYTIVMYLIASLWVFRDER